MTHLANVLLALTSDSLGQDFQTLLERNGFRCVLARSSAEVSSAIRQLEPDLILIGPALADMRGIDLAAGLKADPATASIPLFLLTEARDDMFCRKALEIGVEDTMLLPVQNAALLARMRSLARITTMHAELRLRAGVARRMGISARDKVSLPSVFAPPSLMVVGREEDTAFLRQALESKAEISATTSLYEADALVQSNRFDAAVLFANGNPGPCLDLCSQMRNNARLFNLPVLLVVDGTAVEDPALPYAHGASKVLHTPPRPMQMRAAIEPLVRRQRLRWAISQALSDSMAPSSKHPATDTYNRDFLMPYLADRLDLARTRNQPLSVALFYIPSVSGIRERFGLEAEGNLLNQLGHWISGLLRAEDLTACIGGNEFCVVLPDTPLIEAQIVMQRIAGVLSHTDFAVYDVYEVVQAWVQVGGDESGPYDTSDSIVARARQMLA